MRNLLNALLHKTKKAGLAVDEPQFVHENVQEWIAKENPYQHMTDNDKLVLPSINIVVNRVARSGNEDISTRIFDRLIQKNTLKDDLVVFRGVDDQTYESGLALKHNLDRNYLYYDGYIFCSLNPCWYFQSRKIRMIISLPAGSHYLFTGKYSNTPDSNEIILDKNSILRINKTC